MVTDRVVAAPSPVSLYGVKTTLYAVESRNSKLYVRVRPELASSVTFVVKLTPGPVISTRTPVTGARVVGSVVYAMSIAVSAYVLVRVVGVTETFDRPRGIKSICLAVVVKVLAAVMGPRILVRSL